MALDVAWADDVIGPDKAISDTAVDYVHPSGAIRMAAAADGDVVDGDPRRHGVPNLYVVGASVFRSAGSANPTVTVMAMAISVAELLAGEAGLHMGCSLVSRAAVPPCSSLLRSMEKNRAPVHS